MLQNYNYRARSADNQVVTGVVQAASMEAANKLLVQNKLTPIAITVPKGISDYIPFLNKVSLREKTIFARQLATMIEAGLTLSQALRLSLKQSKKGRMHSIVEAVLSDVEDGFSFSTALAKFPDVFDNIFINIVRAGEATGKLEIVLEQLASNLEKDVTVQGKIKGALFYPAFILIAMVGVAVVMLTQVIPQLADLFTSSSKQLPGSTMFLIHLSNFVSNDWPVVVVGLLVLFFGLRYFGRTETGMQFNSRLFLRLPVGGKIMEETTMARFGRLLGILLSSGVPLLEALRLINDSFSNRVYRTAFRNVSSQVERGIPMSVPIGADPVFPSMVSQMIAVGEQTGKMDEVMTRLAAYYDGEVDTKVASLATLIEPIVIVVLGVGVAWLVIAILLPIYQISTAV